MENPPVKNLYAVTSHQKTETKTKQKTQASSVRNAQELLQLHKDFLEPLYDVERASER